MDQAKRDVAVRGQPIHANSTLKRNSLAKRHLQRTLYHYLSALQEYPKFAIVVRRLPDVFGIGVKPSCGVVDELFRPGGSVLALIGLVLLVLWLLGFVAFHVTSGVIHILLILALISIIIHFLRGRTVA
jgi:hypothetical protein